MSNLKIDYNESLVQITLNRPEKRNALNQQIIEELIATFEEIQKDKKVSIVNIKGEGKLFCAGADIEWMKTLGSSSKEKIQKRFSQLAHMLELLYNLPQITVSTVHGAVYGGGIGLMAACDLTVALEDTTFSFSEINLGLVPSTISPYITKKLGSRVFKKLFVTGEKFNEQYAVQIGLIDDVVGEPEEFMNILATKPRGAMRTMKKLFKALDKKQISIAKYAKSTQLISKLIKSNETQEIFQTFLK